jgi:hypothetical protein
MACVVLGGLLSGAEAKDHVLIMAISDYPSSPKLDGAAIDKFSAKELAERMGYQLDDVSILVNAQLDQAGMRRALKQLDTRVADGDRVFVYFSGHGTTFSTSSGKCEQGIVAFDEKPVSSHEIADMLSAMRERASKVIVILDSCFSGGVVKDAGRGIVSRSAGPKLTAKFSARGDAGGACGNPTNQIALAIDPPQARGVRSRAAYNPEQNFVYLAAAADHEVSLDAGPQGGLATSNLLKCLKANTAKDLDGSGSVSFKELVACAQSGIQSFFPASGEIASSGILFKPHHLTVAGNDGMPVSAAPIQAATQQKPANPKATLQDLLNGRDATWDVRLNVTPNRLRIGKDVFRVSATSNRTGYLYLMYVGSDGKEFALLYPDSRDPEGSNRIEPNQELFIPGEFKANGPAGIDHFVAYVSAQPRPAVLKVFDKDGAAAATLGNAAAITQSACVTRNVSRECVTSEGPTRNVERVTPPPTSATQPAKPVPVHAERRDGYGAAFAETIEE